MSTLNFQNKFEQALHYFRKFIVFAGNVAKDAGVTEMSGDDLLKKVDSVPKELILGIILETNEKYGQELENEDLNPVAKLATQFSPSITVRKILEDAGVFVNYLEENPEIKKKFFLYLKLIRTIVN
jgi:hypothetical protein